MKIIRFKQDVQFDIGYWKYIHNLRAGVEYVFFNKFVERMNDEVKKKCHIKDYDNVVPFYKGENLSGKSLLFITLGGYGDGICFTIALNALRKKYPDAKIDLSANPDMFYFVQQFNFRGGWMNYPVRLATLKEYDYFQASETLDLMPNMGPANIAEKYAELFHVPPDLEETYYTPVGQNLFTKLKPAKAKRIAIQLDAATGSMRTYPFEKMETVFKGLLDYGFEVYLFGLSGEEIPDLPLLYNFANKLPSIADVVQLISQMDLVISPDSAGAHIAGIMNIPAIVLYNVTNTGKFEHYPSVVHMPSQLSCSPCLNIYECPLGYETCEAFDDPSVSPEKIINTAVEILKKKSNKTSN